MWVVAVARASLDVAMSVAASVISSLLLISGDIEENPGPVPGGMIETNDNSIFLYVVLLMCRS